MVSPKKMSSGREGREKGESGEPLGRKFCQLTQHNCTEVVSGKKNSAICVKNGSNNINYQRF